MSKGKPQATSALQVAQARAASGDINPNPNVMIRCTECEITPELRAHFDSTILDIERIWARVDEAHLHLNCERGQYDAEVTLFSDGFIARGELRGANLRAAFDGAIAKIEAQLRRHKKKAVDRERKHDNRDGATQLRNPRETILSQEGITANGVRAEADEPDDDLDDVVRVKRFALKPMSPEEASLQMEMLGHGFFVFRDADSGQTSVVYKRKSGGYGLIEPIAD